jgi:hypothetical protein
VPLLTADGAAVVAAVSPPVFFVRFIGRCAVAADSCRSRPPIPCTNVEAPPLTRAASSASLFS